MDKVFVDTDICIDLLTIRNPFYESAAKLFTLADEKIITLYISATSFVTLDYLLNKLLSNYRSRQVLIKFKTLVSILPVNEKMIELALAPEFEDFEDAIQYCTAIENKVKVILTRNIRDYKKAEIPVTTAEEYITSLKIS